MKPLAIVIRVSLTLILLLCLVFFLGPSAIVDALSGCSWGWLAAAALLAPVFLACRIAKWQLLERQVLPPERLGESVGRYLWGMTLGLITPGRLGELARVRAQVFSLHGAGLFFLEKAIEVSCLFTLCALALPMALGLSVWLLLPLIGVIAFFAWQWRSLARAGLSWSVRTLGRPAPERHEASLWALENLRLFPTANLSMACFFLYVLQCVFVLRGFGVPDILGAVFLFPLVMLANLIPITVGGYGLRETLAVVLFSQSGMPETQAAAAVAIVTFFDLVIPGLLGVAVRVFRHAPSPPPEEEKSKKEDWEVFWEQRHRTLTGRFLMWFRQRFVTSRLVDCILAHIPKGVLIEAGCGSGEVTLLAAAQRGDQVLLIDNSRKALSLARRSAKEMGVEADFLECDLLELSQQLNPPLQDSTVYNVGVVEHFPDCAPALREMARASARPALAIIPERSVFWCLFVAFARLTGMTPQDFYVRLYSEQTFRETIERAGLEPMDTVRIRVLGLIPYVGLRFRATSAEGHNASNEAPEKTQINQNK